jgi:phosphopantothenoylcysteine decarboxylase/phosphopantothenate--cysteine ligase
MPRQARAKGADWILANDVSGDVMGGESNHLHLLTTEGAEDLGGGAKEALARPSSLASPLS